MEVQIRVKRSTGSGRLLTCMAGTMMIINCSSLYAQSSGASGAYDPGPRPVGTTSNFLLPGSASNSFGCGPSPKFTGNPVPPNCINIAQPSTAPQADGAGNIINNPGVLAGLWFEGMRVFETRASVTQQVDSTGAPSTILGLGPSFNAESCFQCHSQPTVGGSSSGKVTIQQPSGYKTFASQVDPLTFQPSGFKQNPEYTIANDASATNNIPCYLTQGGCSGMSFYSGPAVEARFIHAVAPSAYAAGVDSGNVAELFVFAGRNDAPAGCTITQVDPFGTQFQNGNVSFRIPTPTFGLGLVENTSDLTLMNNVVAANAVAVALINKFGYINGAFNRSGNDGTIGRFGWKAQNSSLLMFSGEAANVEMGVTNELFPIEKTWGSGSGCISTNNYPEDQALIVNPTSGSSSSLLPVIENDVVFMRLNGAPSQCNWDSQTLGGVAQCNPLDSDALMGEQLFGTTQPTLSANTAGIGCVLCHTDTLTTAPSATGGLSSATYHPFSDFALHHMGKGDADFITQGRAGGDQFRTAPLWGAGQRLFFMHDGRATDLLQAIADHCPASSATADPADGFPAGEACSVVANFNLLSADKQQQLLKFLRSL